MLSILIPTYNYNVYTLVENIYSQASNLKIQFEVLVYDDGSTNLFVENEQINGLKHAYFTKLKYNIGRSAIRNMLARDAKYDTLLFLDADIKLINSNFLLNYINLFSEKFDIIYGGITYQKYKPENQKLLRWKYGKMREALPLKKRMKSPYISFLTLNFIIKKEVFSNLKFNENIPNSRHEDTLFALGAKAQKKAIIHINNPAIHLGLENNTIFLKKSIESVDNLILFSNKGLINCNDVLLCKVAKKIKTLGISPIVMGLHRLFNISIKKNLLSKKPSLLLFDFYRLGYFLKNSSH